MFGWPSHGVNPLNMKQSKFLNATIWLLASLAFSPCLLAQAAESDRAVQTNSASIAAQTAEQPDGSNAPVASTNDDFPGKGQARSQRAAIVSFGRDVELKAGDSAEAVVVIFGSAKVHGKTRDAVVAIFGNIDIDGEAGDAVVAVMGNVKAEPAARIRGDVVAVGGQADADGATVGGQIHSVTLPEWIKFPEWTKKWFFHCALQLRPLAPQVFWVWVVAAGFLLLYMLTSAVFPRPVQVCVDELTRRPGTTLLMGILTLFLAPLITLLLAATGIGLIVAPFVAGAVFLCGLVGKTAILQSLGFRIGRQFNVQELQHPIAALLLGAILVAVLYLVPVLGLATFGILTVWGLGGAATAAFGGLRRELPEKTAAPQPPPTAMAASAPAPTAAQTAEAGPAETSPPKPVPPVATSTSPVPVPEVLAYPKASFWERAGAAFLDVVLVAVVGGATRIPHLGLLFALAYFASMWTWKGTTIGGIVLGMKVVRLDGQPLTFLVALVRALAAAFSAFVFFLGFLWIALDRDKQGWHDKIAGTVVIRLPRGTPLVCF